jgi:Cu+-exporting ATPase
MKEKDPVCGMLVDPGEAAGQRSFDGRIFYFCSPDCLAKFDKTPQRYAATAPSPPGRKG